LLSNISKLKGEINIMLIALIKSKFILLLPLLIAVGLLNFQGCDDSGIEPEKEPTTDTSVVFYDNISPTFWFSITNTTQMGVNLFDGRIVSQDSTIRDMELIDLNSDTLNFRFRSGDQTIDQFGLATRFKQEYTDIDTTKFDTVSVIKDSDTNLTPTDFTGNDTYEVSGVYFLIDQVEQPVFSFYLQGRNTGNNYYYGMFHVKKVERVYSAPPNESYGVKVTIDIKLNKAGKNKFTK
jgi:hypothetical protein